MASPVVPRLTPALLRKVDGGLLAQGMALFGTGRDATFIRTAGVNRGTTGEAMVVRHLEPKD